MELEEKGEKGGETKEEGKEKGVGYKRGSGGQKQKSKKKINE